MIPDVGPLGWTQLWELLKGDLKRSSYRNKQKPSVNMNDNKICDPSFFFLLLLFLIVSKGPQLQLSTYGVQNCKNRLMQSSTSHEASWGSAGLGSNWATFQRHAARLRRRRAENQRSGQTLSAAVLTVNNPPLTSAFWTFSSHSDIGQFPVNPERQIPLWLHHCFMNKSQNRLLLQQKRFVLNL